MNINKEVERIQTLEEIHKLQEQNKDTRLLMELKGISKEEYKQYNLRCYEVNKLWDKVFELDGII